MYKSLDKENSSIRKDIEAYNALETTSVQYPQTIEEKEVESTISSLETRKQLMPEYKIKGTGQNGAEC